MCAHGLLTGRNLKTPIGRAGNIVMMSVLNAYEASWVSETREQSEIRFHNDEIISEAQYVDTMSEVSDAVRVDSLSSVTSLKQGYARIRRWRANILDPHAAHDPYMVPESFAQAQYSWEIAWTRMLCGGMSLAGSREFLTLEKIEHVLRDAEFDEASLVSMKLGTIQPVISDSSPGAKAGMQHAQLYNDVISSTTTLMKGKRMFLTRGELIGFGNWLVRTGDEIWIPKGLVTPLVHPAYDASDRIWRCRDIQRCEYLLC